MTSTLPPTVDPTAHPGGARRPLGARAPGRPRAARRPEFAPRLRRDLRGGTRAGQPAVQGAGRPAASASGFPKEYGGSDDSGGSVTSIEMLAFGDLSLMVKAGVQWGLFGGAVAAAGHRAAPRRLPARHHELRPARLLRDDRDRPRLRRPAAAAPRAPTTPRRRRSTCTPRTRPPARTTSATRPRTAGWPSSSPS